MNIIKKYFLFLITFEVISFVYASDCEKLKPIFIKWVGSGRWNDDCCSSDMFPTVFCFGFDNKITELDFSRKNIKTTITEEDSKVFTSMEKLKTIRLNNNDITGKIPQSLYSKIDVCVTGTYVTNASEVPPPGGCGNNMIKTDPNSNSNTSADTNTDWINSTVDTASTNNQIVDKEVTTEKEEKKVEEKEEEEEGPSFSKIYNKVKTVIYVIVSVVVVLLTLFASIYKVKHNNKPNGTVATDQTSLNGSIYKNTNQVNTASKPSEVSLNVVNINSYSVRDNATEEDDDSLLQKFNNQKVNEPLSPNPTKSKPIFTMPTPRSDYPQSTVPPVPSVLNMPMPYSYSQPPPPPAYNDVMNLPFNPPVQTSYPYSNPSNPYPQNTPYPAYPSPPDKY